MKRKVTKAVIAVGIILALWLGFLSPAIARIKQNNASVVMLGVAGDLERHVREKGEWPRSWQELYPDRADRVTLMSRTIHVNWQASVEEIVAAVERVVVKQRGQLVPSDFDLPLLVGYTERVPRDKSLVRSEHLWSWMIAQGIHRQQTSTEKD